MKIAFIVTHFPALSETFILNQVIGLLNNGYGVDIYASSPHNTSKVQPNVEKYKLLQRTYYSPIYSDKHLRFVKGIYLGVKIFYQNPIILLKLLTILKDGQFSTSLKRLYQFSALLDKKKYDIIQCHYGPNGIVGAFLKDTGAVQGKLVVTFHGFDLSSYLDEQEDNIYRDLFTKGDLFLPVSEYWKNKLISLGCNENKIIVHRMGINLNEFSFCPRRRRNGNVHVLSVARLVEKKGLEYGILAVSQVVKKYPNIKYKIVGDGPLWNSLTILVEELNMKNNIELIGWKDQSEIAQLMQNVDILLAPSITSQNNDMEGIPVIIMEAMACGLPILSTHHSAIPELVQNGQSGFLVPEKNVDVLAEKLIYLIEHPEIWPVMGRTGREFVEKHYNIDKLNDRLVEIYQSLLAEKLPLIDIQPHT